MSRIKILIADDNLLVAKTLFDKLSRYEDFQIVSIAKDGIETIELLEREKPDVVLLDIIMPKLDGFGVLEHLNVSSKEKPVVIIYSAISQESYISRAMKLGANYYIMKPFNEQIMASRIRQLYSELDNRSVDIDKLKSVKKYYNPHDDELKVLATKYMREYGLKAHMTGYNYIRDIIVLAFDNYCKSSSLPKGVYREIAMKNNVSVQKVERAIRNCIENRIEVDSEQKKLTNSKAICYLIEKIRINN